MGGRPFKGSMVQCFLPTARTCCAGLLLALLALTAVLPHSSAIQGGFVGRQGHQLMLDGKPWYFIGANAYWLWDTAKFGTGHIDDFFKYCDGFNLRVIRIWGYNYKSPRAPGDYDETEMKNLDYIIDQAGKHNVRLLVVLSNFWEAYRSPEELMEMAGEQVQGSDILDYYRSDKVKQFLKKHFEDVVSRKNTITGLEYRNDPTIFGWTAMNEARCPGCLDDQEQADHQAFIDEMSQALQDLAPNQLITPGTEGFFFKPEMVKYNPGAGSRCEGESWLDWGKLSSIDIVTSHIYKRQMEFIPDKPQWRKPIFTDLLAWVTQYVKQHMKAAQEAGKPYIVEEFNLILPKHTKEERTQFFMLIFDLLKEEAEKGGPFSGALFWSAAIGDYAWDEGYNVYLDVPVQQPPPPAQAPSPDEDDGSSSQGGESEAPANTDSEEPDRKDIEENKESLNDFRRVAMRQTCGEEQAKDFKPEWAKDWAREQVDYEGYQERAARKQIQQAIRDAGDFMRQFS